MGREIGTRTVATAPNGRAEHGSVNGSYTRDKGMTKNVTASLTFGSGRITGANGTFTSTFAVNDPVEVGLTNLNNGFFTVTGLDAINAAYLTVDPAPKAEGPLSANVRTA